MSNTVIAIRQSGETSNTPSLGVLANGELALNFADGILYYKTSSNTLGSILTATPGGLDTEVQFNDGGSFGGDSSFTYNKTTNTLTIDNVTTGGLNVAPTLQASFNQANSVFLPSVTRLNVTNDGSSAYLIDQYTGNNPTIYINAGETIAFSLNVTGHPFLIRVSSGGTNYNTGLTHVATDGAVLTNASAQGQVTGTLYWKVPFELASNNYVYQCSIHGGMVGTIRIGQPNALILTQANAAFDQANSANILAQAAFDKANTPDAIAVTANITADAAFVQANAANVLAQASFNFANTANITADAAFSKANAANVLAQASFDFANTISGGAATDNVARVIAQAAFDQANTAIGDSLAFAIALG
jgi:plastocyanin